MSAALIICDIDGTLLNGSSTEVRFARYLIKNRNIGMAALSHWVLFNLLNYRKFGSATWAKNKAWLGGCNEGRTRDLARSFVAAELNGKFNQTLCRLLRQQQAEGVPVVLLSGTLDVLAEAIGEHLGIEHTVATRCQLENQIYTTLPPVFHPQGKEKLLAAREIADQYGVSMSKVTAYADSILDRYLLSNVGNPVTVNADRKLAAVATRNNWEILAFN